jgi:hypothetical protein
MKVYVLQQEIERGDYEYASYDHVVIGVFPSRESANEAVRLKGIGPMDYDILEFDLAVPGTGSDLPIEARLAALEEQVASLGGWQDSEDTSRMERSERGD